MTEHGATRTQNEAALLAITKRLEEDVAKINSELGENRLEIDRGNIINILEVREYDSKKKQMNRLGFELFLESGNLLVWYQEGMINWNQAGGEVIDEGTESLLLRYKRELLPIEEMVDRVFYQWLEKKWKVLE